MKRFILAILTIGFIAFNCNAQILNPTNDGDTLTNADTVNLIQTILGPYNSVAFQTVVTKISGTVAGTALFQGSLDGVNYVDISSDTLTLANQATNTYIWTDTSPVKYYYYRVNIISSGTMPAYCNGYILRR